MRTSAIAAQMLVRLLGVILVILGVLFWLGAARNLVPLHMALGGVLVLAVWVLAGVGARARVGVGLVVLAVVWGLLTLFVAVRQQTWLPGAGHWIIQVLHLLLGGGAIGFSEAIAGRVKRGVPTPNVP